PFSFFLSIFFPILSFPDTDNDKLSGLPQSTTGSLSSIITTSIASSEPDPGTGGGRGRGSSGGGGGGGGGAGGGGSSIGALDASSIAGVPGSSDEKLALNRPGIKQEKWSSILLQVSIPFFLAGVGTIGAGIILGRVEKWRVFKEITELFILVPALLGLKGNLDMCLASRLSTQVNLGNMTTRKEVIKMIVGNIALVQVWFQTHLWITFVIVACYLVLLPMWVAIVLKNKYTRSVLKSGWVPVLSALCISGLGGLVLDAAVEIFDGFVVFQPIINGIGGNLVSVQASKISTMLHQSSIIGIIPPHTKIFEWPWKALFKGVPYAKTARILLGMSIPGNVVFVFVADYIHMSTTTVTFAFVAAFLLASLIQVMLLLYIAHVIVHAMWKWKIDPDNSSIPYLTALGDLLGSSLLALAFIFLLSINQEYGADLNQLNASN
ncbi:PREDICTED: solute carrier family 41 member 1, partial [Rhagoletis zephyria]|uniref:solute carrier family 41 member 1 n=1 Tax=Rhagoletis zephyria TaxID=28612 RepID=UPI00081184C6